jgi:ATP-binding cassette subfamily B protein RaxB
LVRLPLDWFHKRQVGDIQSRFQAIDPIQQFIANGAISAILDGVLGIFVLGLMFYFSPTLGWIVLASVIVYAAIRMAMLDVQRRVAGDYILADAKEQTRFLETLRAAQTIKLGGHENTREAQQRNAIAATINAGIRSGNVSIGFGAVNQLISGAVDVAVVFLAARMIIAGEFTIGMMTAFMAYKGQFVGRMSALIENLISWRLLDVQLERLADIALHPREPRIDDEGVEGEVKGAIALRRVVFRYAPGEPEVLRGADLQIAPGEFVAIAGASGGGKSTLLKILVGLYAPSYGEVLIDGKALTAWSPRALRAQIGFVAQDDVLLQGSIAENIAGFDEQIDMVRVRSAAATACIAQDIEAMPMGYQSLVGDMGSTLSGGQKQRVLIARALYRAPRVLILDEGTSHLDVETERAVNAALSHLSITRIVVAHRTETLQAAGRVAVLRGGRIVELPRSSEASSAAALTTMF